MKRAAFTMIELIFVIVILGILAAVAMPKLIATRDDAIVAKNMNLVRAASDEIASYVFSQMRVEDNLSKMSNVLTEKESEGTVTIDTTNKKAKIKVGDVSDCIILQVVEGAKESNLTLSFGNAGGDALCEMVQDNLDVRNYPIRLRGQIVKF